MLTSLQKLRQTYQPKIPDLLADIRNLGFKRLDQKTFRVSEEIRKLFPELAKLPTYQLISQNNHSRQPLNVGVVFSGGPAPGGHNVIAGLMRGMEQLHPDSRLFGFINGPSGCVNHVFRELFSQEINSYLNQGGFDLIGTGRAKIETTEQMAAVLEICQKIKLDGLVIIGGDDSNTNGAVLAEYFLQHHCMTSVVGIPKTIDGDLRNQQIEISFGFDTACKVYAEMIGNICRDALSSRKYYHFIKLMGRSASNITLECALQVHPNFTFIAEELSSLNQIVQKLADLIESRAKIGKEYGVILLPEGLIEFIPEMKSLIDSLNHGKELEEEQKALFLQLPESMRSQLLEKDPHGNLSLSSIATEELLISFVKQELKKRNFSGTFSCQGHFLGYEGRSASPSNFDADYTYALGILSALAVKEKATGVICAMSHLTKPASVWQGSLTPLISMLHLETRKGKLKPVIQKALVDLKGKPFLRFTSFRKTWEKEDAYQYPGPIQFWGPSTLTDSVPLTLDC